MDNKMNFTIVIRKLGKAEPEDHLAFDLPEVPRIGDYISIYRPVAPGTIPTPPRSSDDLVVRHVWWNLEHVTADPQIFRVGAD